MLGFSILVDAALKGSIVLAVAAAAAWVLRRRSAAVRHIVWTAAAAALIALPILTATLPALRVPVAPEGPMTVFRVFATSRSAAPTVSSAVPAMPAAAVAEATSLDPRRWTAAIWAAGAAIGLLQMLLACGAVWRLRRGARRLDDGGIASELGIYCPVEVLESEREGMPIVFGVFRPTVLLPAGAAEWRPDRLRVVLLHELAHVRRGDVATHLLARTALALYWWNPLAWFAWREFLKERERATDDLVLYAGERASDYATHLLEVARTLQPAPATAWAAIAMARRSQLEGRLIAILDSGVQRRAWGRRAQAAAVAIAIALIAPFAAVQAQDPSIPPETEATIRAANAQKNHEILDRAAAAYEKIAKFDVARALLESSLEIRQQSGSAAYAAGLVKLGDLAVKRGQRGEALAFYTKAVSLGDRVEVTPALVHLGERAFGVEDSGNAEDLFRRVLKLETKGPSAGRALMFLAQLRRKAVGGEPEAELLYQRSIEADPQNYQAMRNYAALLRRQNRNGEAVEMAARTQSEGRPMEAAVNSRDAYRVGGGVSAPALLFKSEPEYSEEARAAKYQGTVLLYVEIAPDGTAQNIVVLRRLGLGLDEKAIESVRRWKFRPGMKDGVPVTVQATIEVNFRLQ
jgi:TonB family protein